MTKTQYYTATTIDGFIADEHHSLEWLFAVERSTEQPDGFTTFYAEVGAMAMGASTYEWVLDHDQLLDQPEKWQAFYGDTPCWVFAHRDLPAVPGADLRFVRDDVRPVHAAMTEAAAGQNIWLVGGGDLVGQFTDHGLLDEVLLCVAPVALGAGRSAAAAPAHRLGPAPHRRPAGRAVRAADLHGQRRALTSSDRAAALVLARDRRTGSRPRRGRSPRRARAISSAVRCSPTAPRLSSSCSTVRAPRITEVMPGRSTSQARATCGHRDTPRSRPALGRRRRRPRCARRVLRRS